MFFGDIKPSDEHISKAKIVREPFVKCSTDKGPCIGSLPHMVDGEQKVQFVYLNYGDIDMTGFDIDTVENRQAFKEEYSRQFNMLAVYDDGMTVTKCTVIIGQDTYCWIE